MLHHINQHIAQNLLNMISLSYINIYENYQFLGCIKWIFFYVILLAITTRYRNVLYLNINISASIC
jgi:hypothetical protein